MVDIYICEDLTVMKTPQYIMTSEGTTYTYLMNKWYRYNRLEVKLENSTLTFHSIGEGLVTVKVCQKR